MEVRIAAPTVAFAPYQHYWWNWLRSTWNTGNAAAWEEMSRCRPGRNDIANESRRGTRIISKPSAGDERALADPKFGPGLARGSPAFGL